MYDECMDERMFGAKSQIRRNESMGNKVDKVDKLKALDAAIAHIEKQYGKGSVMKLGDNTANMDVETVPTGALSLDLALGLGGVPKGRIIEIYGPESSGKTTVTLHMVAEVQKLGGIAGFIDAEHALDPAYARNIGVDIDNLYISQPDNGEQLWRLPKRWFVPVPLILLLLTRLRHLFQRRRLMARWEMPMLDCRLV